MLPADSTRRTAYALILTLAFGSACGRILSAERLNEPSVHRADDDRATPRPAWPKARPSPTPLFGSNDRSRWALVRALVDEGTFEIGRRDIGVIRASAVAVLAAPDPVSLAAVLDAGYKLRIRSDKGIIFEPGWESVDKVMDPDTFKFYSTKPPLLSVLVAGEYWCLQRLFGWRLDDGHDLFLIVRAVLFSVNALPLLLYLLLLTELAERFAVSDFAKLYIVGAGAFATMVTPFLVSFNNHTPATTGALIAVWAAVRLTLGGGAWLYAVAGLAAGFTACNELPAASLAAGLFAFLAWRDPRRACLLYLPAALLPVAAMGGLNYLQLGRVTPAYAEFGGAWYQYEGSHWLPPGMTKRGIDYARRNGETHAEYAFHLLVGHHGLFSLMPVFALAFAGMAIAPRFSPGEERPPVRLFGLFALAVSVVVIGFYLFKSDNYGGWCNGPRWLMWVSALWLPMMAPALDAMATRRWARGLALALLAWSAMSMHYQSWSPWRHPWIYNAMEAAGRIAY